ncbi:hypothetical protein FB451DRAFT_1302632 [Mycena latifolia]|nr:hypothetical protein FB451DRAFT_1302632 [Mycena latifolia]
MTPVSREPAVLPLPLSASIASHFSPSTSHAHVHGRRLRRRPSASLPSEDSEPPLTMSLPLRSAGEAEMDTGEAADTPILGPLRTFTLASGGPSRAVSPPMMALDSPASVHSNSNSSHSSPNISSPHPGRDVGGREGREGSRTPHPQHVAHSVRLAFGMTLIHPPHPSSSSPYSPHPHANSSVHSPYAQTHAHANGGGGHGNGGHSAHGFAAPAYPRMTPWPSFSHFPLGSPNASTSASASASASTSTSTSASLASGSLSGCSGGGWSGWTSAASSVPGSRSGSRFSSRRPRSRLRFCIRISLRGHIMLTRRRTSRRGQIESGEPCGAANAVRRWARRWVGERRWEKGGWSCRGSSSL